MVRWGLLPRLTLLIAVVGILLGTCAVPQLQGSGAQSLTDPLSLPSSELPAVQLFAELERQVGLRVVSAAPGNQVIEVGENPTAASILQAITERTGVNWALEGETAVIGGHLRQSQRQQERAEKRTARRKRLVHFLESLPEGVQAQVEAGRPLRGPDIRSLPPEAQQRLHELLSADLGGYEEALNLTDNDAVTVVFCPQVLFLRADQPVVVDTLRLFPRAYFQNVCEP